jgi:hypothetical protein
MVRGRYFGSCLIEQYYFLQLKLPVMFFKERQANFSWDGVIVQREYLVGREVEVPGKRV